MDFFKRLYFRNNKSSNSKNKSNRWSLNIWNFSNSYISSENVEQQEHNWETELCYKVKENITIRIFEELDFRNNTSSNSKNKSNHWSLTIRNFLNSYSFTENMEQQEPIWETKLCCEVKENITTRTFLKSCTLQIIKTATARTKATTEV